MMKRKMLCSLLIIFLLCVPSLAACSDWRIGETYTEETKVVTDENGTHVVTYRYVDSTKHRGIQVKSLLLVLVAEVVMVGLGLFMFGRVKEIRDLKNCCTQEVSAVITEVRRSRGDRGIRRRGWQYNATYRFFYKGRTYESDNGIFGKRRMGFAQPKPIEGEEVTVRIAPSDPAQVYDDLAEVAGNWYLYTTVILWGGAVVILVIVITALI